LDPKETKTDWKKADSTGVTLTSVDMLTDYFSYAAGSNGNIKYYNGTKWIAESSPTYADLSDVKIISESNVIAICTQTIYKFNGITWSAMEEPEGYYNYYYSITALDENHIWVGGDSGKIYFYNGSTWSTIDLDNSSIGGIYAVDANNVFAFDNSGKVIHYNGIGWAQLVDLEYSYFNSIFAFSENNIWIGGNSGQLFHYDGSAWQEIDVAGHHIFDICGLESGDVWFACNAGVILHWDGSKIKKSSTPTEQNLYGISMLNENKGFAVGRYGIILKYNK